MRFEIRFDFLYEIKIEYDEQRLNVLCRIENPLLFESLLPDGAALFPHSSIFEGRNS